MHQEAALGLCVGQRCSAWWLKRVAYGVLLLCAGPAERALSRRDSASLFTSNTGWQKDVKVCEMHSLGVHGKKAWEAKHNAC